MAILLEFNLQETTEFNLDIPWSEWFLTWLENLAKDLPYTDEGTYEVSLRLTDDLEIQSFNSEYRSLDMPTDVLAFAALEVEILQPEESLLEPLYLGDIIISVETAKRQAIDQEHSLRVELAWLASHGLLHLLGWDHPDQESLEAMLTRQANLLKSIELLSDKSPEKAL